MNLFYKVFLIPILFFYTFSCTQKKESTLSYPFNSSGDSSVIITKAIIDSIIQYDTNYFHSLYLDNEWNNHLARKFDDSDERKYYPLIKSVFEQCAYSIWLKTSFKYNSYSKVQFIVPFDEAYPEIILNTYSLEEYQAFKNNDVLIKTNKDFSIIRDSTNSGFNVYSCKFINENHLDIKKKYEIPTISFDSAIKILNSVKQKSNHHNTFD